MAIPQKPLIIVDWEKRTLRENRAVFSLEYVIDDFYEFLLRHVDHKNSWTEEEIGNLEVSELDDVHLRVFEFIRGAAVPLPK